MAFYSDELFIFMCFPFLRACVHWLLPLLILNSLTLERPAWMHRRSCSVWVPSPYSNFHFGAPFFHPLPHVHYAFQHVVCLSPFTWVVAPSIKHKPVNVGKEYTKSYCIGRNLIALVYSPGFRILVPINISRGGKRTRFGEASIRFPQIVPHPIRV